MEFSLEDVVDYEAFNRCSMEVFRDKHMEYSPYQVTKVNAYYKDNNMLKELRRSYCEGEDADRNKIFDGAKIYYNKKENLEH